MLAYALLVVVALTECTRQPAPLGVVELTCSEIQRLFAALVGRPAVVVRTGCAVVVATTAPGPHSSSPLPATSHTAAMNTTKSGWRVSIFGAQPKVGDTEGWNPWPSACHADALPT